MGNKHKISIISFWTLLEDVFGQNLYEKKRFLSDAAPHDAPHVAEDLWL